MFCGNNLTFTSTFLCEGFLWWQCSSLEGREGVACGVRSAVTVSCRACSLTLLLSSMTRIEGFWNFSG